MRCDAFFSPDTPAIEARRFHRQARAKYWAVAILFAVVGLLVLSRLAHSGELSTGREGKAGSQTNLCAFATTAPAYPGVINKSAVVMRSLVPRPSNPHDPHDTLEAVRRFHVTRLEWVYGLTPDFVKKAKALGVSVSGATSCNTALSIANTPDAAQKFCILDLNLHPITAPWMRKWNPPGLWLCVNNPTVRERSLAQIEQQYDLGLRDLQRDDPQDNEAALGWGGCFCQYCMAGFRDYLKKNCSADELRALGVSNVDDFDYRKYLLDQHAPVGDQFKKYDGGRLKELFEAFEKQSTIAFHVWWRGELNKHAGHYVPVSCNNNSQIFTGPFALFDFYVGELFVRNNKPEFFFQLEQTVKKLGKGQTLTMPEARDVTSSPAWIRQIRQAIAAAYATGLHIEAPWDAYIIAQESSRFFGEPKDFSDLFAMVRASAELLDGYEDVAATGMQLPDARWDSSNQPVSILPGAAPVTAFVRAKPGHPEAPVVIHLINWSEHPEACKLALRPQMMFAGKPFQAVLLTPVPYQQQAHDAAFASGDYSKLVQRTVLGSGEVSTLEIPALDPWGILVLEPLKSASTRP